jgi:hypothetical protein
MIVNFAVKELEKVPDNSIDCSFSDMDKETQERQNYARLACQLGIMGRDSKGKAMSSFSPNGQVTRAQFGTVLSRVLWGNIYDGGTMYYSNHLKALQKVRIIKSSDNASSLEKRGYVMLMLMRSSELK